jgi:hypothetical protein
MFDGCIKGWVDFRTTRGLSHTNFHGVRDVIVCEMNRSRQSCGINSFETVDMI